MGPEQSPRPLPEPGNAGPKRRRDGLPLRSKGPRRRGRIVLQRLEKTLYIPAEIRGSFGNRPWPAGGPLKRRPELTAKSSTYRRESPRRFKGRLRKGLAEIERKR